MHVRKMTVIDIWELKGIFFKTYGYNIINMHELLFGDNFSNDSYKMFHLTQAEEDEDTEEDVLKIVKMLRNLGFDEDEILIDITW